ncbi:hypothetical protein MUK42_11284 [Musa troglodytarum]|uniref:Transmembrane protein n=1 Tax=Musa troglodytarum TaxID=320322 RepID=A0A9E7KH83_9LILI|nr:hypothetical protein MUK42_11284 [Musa troglodytarum]
MDDRRPSPPPPPAAQDRNARCSWLFDPMATFVILYLVISVIISVYRSRGDPSMLVFVLFSCSDLLFLFLCLRRFERLAPGSPPAEKVRLKMAVWLLSAALVLAFSCRVSSVMPRALAALVWLMAGSVLVGGFYGLFLYKEQDDERER